VKSDVQISQERKAWARGTFVVAWLKVCRAVDRDDLTHDELDEFQAELDEARAVATEWGIDCRQIVEDLAEQEVTADA
jgi:hypothetical protein